MAGTKKNTKRVTNRSAKRVPVRVRTQYGYVTLADSDVEDMDKETLATIARALKATMDRWAAEDVKDKKRPTSKRRPSR